MLVLRTMMNIMCEAEYEMADTSLVLIKFRIRGLLRFLSHAETVNVFQRACIRAGIKIRYSQGFNPRPKLSLPLPRSVGVESDDDLLCLHIQNRQPTDNQSESSASWLETERLKAWLSSQLPEGCELITVSVEETKAAFRPRLATYVLAVRREYLNEKLKARIKRLLADESIYLERRIDAKGSIRSVDVRPFLKSVEFDNECIAVECKISSAGSIRVDEILKLLELDAEKLAAPIRRTSVQWQVGG